MAGSLVAVGAVYYVVQATANDGDLLDLDNIELSQSSVVMATDPDTGAQVEYATLRSSNSHRVWADLEQIPTNLQYAFICTEDKDFYNEPGVNFKRTIGAMVNEYLLPIYSSKQGASTLEQQLIKNLTDDKSASGIEGALRKLREIYRALCLSRSYSKETILEAYLNTISFTGTIQGVQTAANEYFNKDVSQLTLWECATIASITKNPTNYNPYTNPSGGAPVPPQPPVYSAVPFEGMEPPAGYPQKSRLAAGILGILGGTLGLHNFYLGNSQRGLIQILVATLGAALTCGISTVAMMIWGIVEGIQILEHKINADGNGIKLKD